MRRWVRRHGAIPAAIDWDPSRARATGQDWRAQRFEEDRYVNAATVRRRFGSWNAAVRAAGFEPNPAPARGAGHRGREAVLVALRTWHDRYGAPPTMADWEPSRARRLGQHWRAERYAAGDWPSMRTVRYHFDTLSAAVVEAGLKPVRRGRRSAAARAVEREAWVKRAAGAASADARAVASAVRAVAVARKDGSDERTRRALVELAVAALSWAETIPAVTTPESATVATANR